MSKESFHLKMDFMFKQLFGYPRRKSITIVRLDSLLNRVILDRIADLRYENAELKTAR
ncbi:hypothetical protein [Thermaerobacillus caldiproteolyticus]|uniref:hypothetical protein n=1 Tax=Thermaerobacillus caldiproteolyticus TaxID=247480 RepID=UPI001889C6FC|nr:hypothetical protein [Anoxybacillus caldiproteolyticus]QPA32280.1 hypothetical protein ISX45_04705 [Anoxybacillus caldiproteolyticus]